MRRPIRWAERRGRVQQGETGGAGGYGACFVLFYPDLGVFCGIYLEASCRVHTLYLTRAGCSEYTKYATCLHANVIESVALHHNSRGLFTFSFERHRYGRTDQVEYRVS